MGICSWHDTVLSVVSHSLMVSESFSCQLLCHLGAQYEKPLMFVGDSITSPQVLQTFSPMGPWGASTFPLQCGQFVVFLSPGFFSVFGGAAFLLNRGSAISGLNRYGVMCLKRFLEYQYWFLV